MAGKKSADGNKYLGRRRNAEKTMGGGWRGALERKGALPWLAVERRAGLAEIWVGDRAPCVTYHCWEPVERQSD